MVVEDIFGIQSRGVSDTLMLDMNMTRKNATEFWSKTCNKLVNDTIGYLYFSVARCYDELNKEIEHNPYWMMLINP